MKHPRLQLAQALGWSELAWEDGIHDTHLEGIRPYSHDKKRSRVPPFERSMASAWKLVRELCEGPFSVSLHQTVDGESVCKAKWHGPGYSLKTSHKDNDAPYAISVALADLLKKVDLDPMNETYIPPVKLTLLSGAFEKSEFLNKTSPTSEKQRGSLTIVQTDKPIT